MGGRALGRRASNLPAELTSFIGRRQELREVKRLLGTTRLLTLTGSGGAGKTRLALRAAAEMARGFPEGVWLVSLAPVQDPLLVSEAVFRVLGAQDQSAGWSVSALSDYLAGKRLLLVLDNCEHLLDACAVLAGTLLKNCPDLQLLATSRQALGVAGEVRMPVPPMPVPAGEAAPVEQILGSEAVWLFRERAAAVVPGFVVDAENAGAVLQLCQRLDGIPLALELAAVRLGALSLDQLNQGLTGELSILGSANRDAEARQQTLEATIGWSYRLLDEAERVLWARLSVFAGGFDADAATEVCSGTPVPPERVVEVLGALVEKSVLKRVLRGGTAARYWLLDTLRQFGRQRLREMGEQISTQERHLQWVSGLARPLNAFDRRQAELFRRLDTERDNLWAALDFCVKQPVHADTAGQMAMHLITYWGSRGSFGDVRRVLTTVSEAAPENSQARARLLVLVAIVALLQNDWDAGHALAGEIRQMATVLKDHELMAWSLEAEALPLFMSGRVAEAIERGESAVSLAHTMQDRSLNIVVTASFCPVLVAAGRLERAIELGEPALAESRKRGELWGRGYLLNALCQVRWRQGETELAEAMAREGAACKHAVQDQNGLQALLETLAWMTAGRGAHERAAMLLGCAEQVRLASGIPFQELYQRQQHDESVALATRALGQDAFDAAYRRGLAMPVDDALGVATAGNHRQPPKPTPVRPGTASPLTRREREIAGLIAGELTTKEIAARLFVSERTVEAHVTHMFNKLGVSSRAQLTRWLASTAGAGSAEPGKHS
jgi:predicted ATPase/DNA-binding CsgD family transcriptional regulator